MNRPPESGVNAEHATNTAPSIAPSQTTTLNDDNNNIDASLQSFTATGRPFPKTTYSALSSLGAADAMGGNGAVNKLPWKYYDDDYISVPVVIYDDDDAGKDAGVGAVEDDGTTDVVKDPGRKRGWIGRLIVGGGFGDGGGGKANRKKKGKGNAKGDFKVVRMTRGEYLRKWAMDENGTYIGSDPVPGRFTRAMASEMDRSGEGNTLTVGK